MKAWLMNLSQRERVMVVSAALVVFLFLIYIVLINPITSSYERKKRNIAQAEETIRWMKSAAVEIQNLRGTSTVKRPQGKQFLLGTIDRSIKKAKLASVMKRIQPEGSSGVRLWFENAEFNALIRWLDTIEKVHGFSLNEISIDKTETSGMVNARVFLESF